MNWFTQSIWVKPLDSLNRKGKNLESRGGKKTDFGGYLLGYFILFYFILFGAN